MQKTRHPLNMPQLYPGIPCVLDVDDADFHHPDRAEHERAACGSAAAIIGGSRYISRQLASMNAHVSTVWTCSYIQQPQMMTPQASRRPVVCWAASDPAGYPLELAFVRDVVLKVQARMPCEFWIFGFKPGYSAVQDVVLELERAGAVIQTWPSMAYRDFVELLSDVAVGLNPVCEDNLFSRGKSFGKLLAYMASDVAIVGTHALDYPLFFEPGRSAELLENDASVWAEHVASLLNDAVARHSMAQQARVAFEARLNSRVAARALAHVLDEVALRP